MQQQKSLASLKETDENAVPKRMLTKLQLQRSLQFVEASRGDRSTDMDFTQPSRCVSKCTLQGNRRFTDHEEEIIAKLCNKIIQASPISISRILAVLHSSASEERLLSKHGEDKLLSKLVWDRKKFSRRQKEKACKLVSVSILQAPHNIKHFLALNLCMFGIN